MHQEQLIVLQRKQTIENNRTMINRERKWRVFGTFCIIIFGCGFLYTHATTEPPRPNENLFIHLQLLEMY